MSNFILIGAWWYASFILSTVIHEAAHAWAALKLGDETAYEGGQVSLNPEPHIRREPFGMVVIPLLTYFIGGWMMGWASAPYDPTWAMQYPKRAALMALAGPVSNLCLAVIAGVIILMDSPFQVGDRAQFGSTYGEVVEIGLRTVT